MKQTYKIPDGVKELEITQHDDKIVIEFIPDFKRGDVLASDWGGENIVIILKNVYDYGVSYYATLSKSLGLKIDNDYLPEKQYFRHATEAEKQLLFDKLKEQGKRWNFETMELEDIPEKLKEGELAIFWDGEKEADAVIGAYSGKTGNKVYPHASSFDRWYQNAVKFQSMEQYEKIRKGKI